MIIDFSIGYKAGHFSLYTKWLVNLVADEEEIIIKRNRDSYRIFVSKLDRIIFSSTNLIDRHSIIYLIIAIFRPSVRKYFIVHSLPRRWLSRIFVFIKNAKFFVFSDALKSELERIGLTDVERVMFPNAYLLSAFKHFEKDTVTPTISSNDFVLIWGRSCREIREEQLHRLDELGIPFILTCENQTHEVFENLTFVGEVSDAGLERLIKLCRFTVMYLTEEAEKYFRTKLAASGVYETNSYYGKFTAIIGDFLTHRQEIEKRGNASFLMHDELCRVRYFYNNTPSTLPVHNIKIEEFIRKK